MNIRNTQCNGWEILSIQEDLDVRTDLSELAQAVQSLIDMGTAWIALRFTPDTYFGTKAVAMCVRIARDLCENGGALAFLDPSPQIRDILKITDLNALAAVYPSEEGLPQA